jgi:hypothetical protein
MNPTELENWILEKYKGIVVTNAYRERSFFYNPEYSLPKGIYFATIKESDGPNDRASKLDREGIYRFSIGVGKKQYQEMFGEIPKRPAKGNIVGLDLDFSTLNEIMPHPIYAWMGWICILNPKLEIIESIKNLLDISYLNCLMKYKRKSKK